MDKSIVTCYQITPQDKVYPAFKLKMGSKTFICAFRIYFTPNVLDRFKTYIGFTGSQAKSTKLICESTGLKPLLHELELKKINILKANKVNEMKLYRNDQEHGIFIE